jgi:hypothetical protein
VPLAERVFVRSDPLQRVRRAAAPSTFAGGDPRLIADPLKRVTTNKYPLGKRHLPAPPRRP